MTIPMFKVRMSNKAIENVAEVLKSGMIGEGPEVARFKQKLEERFNCKNLLPLNSCTSALTLALRLAEVEGGEVITTPFTMIATNVAIKAAGAEIVFADIEENSVNISTKDIYNKISHRTKAIVITCVGGVPPEMAKLAGIDHIPIIIDAAQAIGAYYDEQHISQFGEYICFSFQAIKQLTTGDGGALIVKNNYKYQIAEKLKWFGMTRTVPAGMTRLQHQMSADVEDWGYKFHMNDITATIGLANLEELDEVINKHAQNAEYFLKELRGIKGITLPLIPDYCKPSWYAFYMFVENRDVFMRKMAEKGIETTPMWRRNDEYSAFKKYNILPLPNMTRLQNKIVFIPVGWWLTNKDREYIVEKIKEGW